MTLTPFQRPSSDQYSTRAEIEGFFNDFYEWNRMKLEPRVNKFAPKSDFLKQRAISLFRSGYKQLEISEMLQISKETAYCWVDPEYRERREAYRIDRREAAALVKEPSASQLPTLPFVPQIELTPKSKYRMSKEYTHVFQ